MFKREQNQIIIFNVLNINQKTQNIYNEILQHDLRLLYHHQNCLNCIINVVIFFYYIII